MGNIEATECCKGSSLKKLRNKNIDLRSSRASRLGSSSKVLIELTKSIVLEGNMNF